MAKKTSTKKTAVKSAGNPPVVPAVVKCLNTVAVNLLDVSDIPKELLDARTKLVGSINRLGVRVAANIAGAGKKAEKATAKAKRADAKKDRDATRRTKKVAARDALRAKLAVMDADLKS